MTATIIWRWAFSLKQFLRYTRHLTKQAAGKKTLNIDETLLTKCSELQESDFLGLCKALQDMAIDTLDVNVPHKIPYGGFAKYYRGFPPSPTLIYTSMTSIRQEL
jgi:hypothetical protein